MNWQGVSSNKTIVPLVCQKLNGISSEPNDIFLFHCSQQPAYRFPMCMQFIGYLLMGDINMVGICGPGTFPNIVQYLFFHIIECDQIDHIH